MFKGQVTHIMSFLMSFFVCFKKLSFYCLLLLLSSLLNFDFAVYFYILILYSVLVEHKLRSSTIDKIRKIVFTAEILTVASTLKSHNSYLRYFLIVYVYVIYFSFSLVFLQLMLCLFLLFYVQFRYLKTQKNVKFPFHIGNLITK